MNHYIFIIYLISFLFPSFSGIPKVPHSDFFLYAAILAYLLYKPILFLNQINYYIVITFVIHYIYILLNLYNINNNRTLGAFLIPFLAVNIFWSFYNTHNTTNRKQLIYVVYVGLVATSITTVVSLYFFPEAGRLLAGSLAKEGNYELNNFFLLLGIGSYNFSYMWMVSILLIMNYLSIKKKIDSKYAYIFVIGLFFYGIIQISITAPIVILFIGILLYFTTKQLRSIKKFRVFIIVIAVVVMHYSNYLSGPVYYIAENISFNENISNRMLNIAMRLDGSIESVEFDLNDAKLLDENDIYIGSYQVRANKSINSFINSPIFGGGEVGGHNFYLDILGAFGIIGFGVVILGIISMYDKARKKLNTINSKKIYEIIFILFILLGLIKTYSLNIMFLFTFFIVPQYLIYTESFNGDN